jgi:nicotinate-nucleotide--dimethylbenzimidazole phosphoribosyltransferase
MTLAPALDAWTPPTLPALDGALASELQRRIDAQAKPPGALGRLEGLAVQLGVVQNRLDPRADEAVVLLFAGDHGLTEEGVSAYPSAVTAAMVRLILDGRASISALARAAGARVQVIDAGVAAELDDHPDLLRAKVRAGTRNAAREPAMTPEECQAALECGAKAARAAAAAGAEVIALGEMGIGNTASASLILHRLGPAPLADCIGLGAGHDAEGLARKIQALEMAAARSDAAEPFEVLRQFGGFEIAAMAGAALAAAEARRLVVVDGFIASAAALVALRLRPELMGFCVFAHASAERGHRLLLERIGARPLLELDMRLGEGTGAALALPILRAAGAMVREVALLAEVLGQS